MIINEDLNIVINFRDKLLSMIDLIPNDNVLSDHEYQKIRTYLLRKYGFKKVPDFLKECRTLNDFIFKLKEVASGRGSWQARREYIYDSFKFF